MTQTSGNFTMIFSAKSDIGLVRTENQDSFGKFPDNNTDLNHSEGQLFIVADGMGGHKGGKEASTIAVEVISREFVNSAYEESLALKNAIEKANETIYRKAGESLEFGSMGTTCSVLLIKGEKAVIGHVGDSRIYKIENDTIEQLTSDHTKVQEMLSQGILTPQEAKNYPSKSVLARALGVDKQVRVDIIENITLRSGQSYILCSDGLAKVSKEEILSIVSGNNPEESCRLLVDMANERGGKDNVTVIVIKIDPGIEKKIRLPVAEKKVIARPERKKRKWPLYSLIVIIVFLVLFLLKDSILSSFSGDNNAADSTVTATDIRHDAKPNQDNEKSDLLVDKANSLLKKGDYENAFAIYKQVLDMEPMHQAALKGINEIASVYMVKADNLMNMKNFDEALVYYKKAQQIQPGNEKINNQIRLCISQIGYQLPETGSDTLSKLPDNTPPVSNVRLTTTRFDDPGWSYPGINKNEFEIKSYVLNFHNTLTQKYIIYNADLYDVTIAVTVSMSNLNSVAGLIIGYSSPNDYYIFKHRNGGDYILQRINGNDIQNLLLVNYDSADESGKNQLKIQYSDNLISIYSTNGLLNSFKINRRISGKAGIFVDKNSTVNFQNIFLSSNNRLN